MAGVFSAWWSPDTGLLSHLAGFVLPAVTLNTLVLVTGVALATAVIGVTLGWLSAMYRFPGSRFFSWALLLPMAIPAYVVGFVYIGLLEYAGPLQGALRSWTGVSGSIIPVRSAGGVIGVMSLALYPYIYLLSRNAFMTQGSRAIEVAATLGLGRTAAFWRVALPMARPWIAGGLMLVVMEVLADFGTVAVFNYDTFTTAIYKSWFSLFSLQSALQLASVLLLLVFALLVVERRLRGRARFDVGISVRPPRELPRSRALLATGLCLLVLCLGFVIPSIQLILWAVADGSRMAAPQFGNYAIQTLLIALLAVGSTSVVALVLVYALRTAPGALTRLAARIATLGYALPGTVLAVGIYTLVAAINTGLNELLSGPDSVNRLFLQGTLLATVAALTVRFVAVAYQPVNNALRRLSLHVDEACKTLGVSGLKLVSRVYIPVLRSGLLTAMVLVFVDVMKEMPITLMTRPFGWDTLAVRVFEMTSEGEWQGAALPALAIVGVGLIPVILITRAAGDATATR